MGASDCQNFCILHRYFQIIFLIEDAFTNYIYIANTNFNPCEISLFYKVCKLSNKTNNIAVSEYGYIL